MFDIVIPEHLFTAMYTTAKEAVLLDRQVIKIGERGQTFLVRRCPGVGISKGRKCCDLVNASYLWLTDRACDAFTRSQHLLPFEIPTPVSELNL